MCFKVSVGASQFLNVHSNIFRSQILEPECWNISCSCIVMAIRHLDHMNLLELGGADKM